MTKEQKIQLVQELTQQFEENSTFYVADAGGLTVAEMQELRSICYEHDVTLRMVKNTLIQKALDNLDADYSDLYPSLKQPSSVFFTTAENPSVPAKVIKEYRKASKTEKPILKAAVIDAAVFTGDDQLELLSKMKSKNELIGEIVGLLQSPAKNVVSALKSAGGTLAGILKTLSEREE